MDKQTKWNEFKQKRHEVIDLYIRRRRVQERALDLLRYFVINKMYQTFKDNFQILKQRKINRNMGKFLSVVLANHWIKNLSRFAPKGDLKLIYQRRVKHLLTFHAITGFDSLSKKSSETIFPFLLKLATISDLTSKGRRMFQ